MDKLRLVWLLCVQADDVESIAGDSSWSNPADWGEPAPGVIGIKINVETGKINGAQFLKKT